MAPCLHRIWLFLIRLVAFALVVVAALGSAVAMMEPIVRMVMQHRRWPRFIAVLVVTGIVGVVGLASILSFSLKYPTNKFD